jgi:hypothetical protein
MFTTSQGLQPTPSEIAPQLGTASTSHALDREILNGLHAAHGRLPSVQLKRLLCMTLATADGDGDPGRHRCGTPTTATATSSRCRGLNPLLGHLASRPELAIVSGFNIRAQPR